MFRALTTKCIICRKQEIAALANGERPRPYEWQQVAPVFQHCQVWTFHIKLNRKTLKEAQVVIFTCMTTRAVYLEIVIDK